MAYLIVNYISKKLKYPFRNFCTPIIDSEVEDFCNEVLYKTLNSKKEQDQYPINVIIQQELILYCFLSILSTNYKEFLNINDVHFYIDNIKIEFDENWQQWLNIKELLIISSLGLYNKFIMSIAL